MLTLWISQRIPYLLQTKFAILNTCSILTNAFHHELLILFTEAVSFHGGIRQPPHNKGTPEDGNDTVCEEKRLP
jgi:hypothetical protein